MTAEQLPSPEFLALQAAVAGRYVVDREIGRGGMGAVFLARDVALERPVAIKLLLPHLATDPALRERFLREARTAAQLMHPNIVPIYAVEQQGDLVWFVMGYIAGETLTERVRRSGTMSPDEALAVLRDVAWALAYAHGRGVIHRDIKPDNILLDAESGRALVADFGIARVASRDTLTDEGAFVGTVEYMSREQASALPVDGRSDVYSLGASTFFALVGESPVRAPSLPAALGRLMREESPNIVTARPDVPATLGDVLARCLAREAEHRLGSAEQLVTELRALDRATPRVRPEIKAFLTNLTGLQTVAAAGAGAALIAGVTWDLEFIEATTRDGFVVGGVGFVAMAALLVATGLLTLRPQGVSYRELLDGLSAEANEATHTARALLRKAFRGNARTLQKSFVWTGLFNIVAYSIFAISAMKALGGLDAEFTLAAAVTACLAGVGVGVKAIWRGLQPHEAFDGYLRSREETPAYRALIRFAQSRIVRRWWQREGQAEAEAPALSVQPTATLLIQRIESLFAQLPTEVRARLSNLVPAAAGLERVCTALRARIEQVDRAMAELPLDSPARLEFAAMRERASARLADGVTALESLRTDLLRLGVGLRDTDGLTLELQHAKELSAAIDAELHGQTEVKKLLG